MKYQMNVKIIDPNTEEGMVSGLFFQLDWEFSYDKKRYGNGFYARAKGKGFDPMGFDLRYDRSFDKNHPEKWMEEWARNYWNGREGAWQIARLDIQKC